MNKYEAIWNIVYEAKKKRVTETGYKRCKRSLKYLGVPKPQARATLQRLDFHKFVDADKDFIGVEANAAGEDI